MVKLGVGTVSWLRRRFFVSFRFFVGLVAEILQSGHLVDLRSDSNHVLAIVRAGFVGVVGSALL